MKNASGAITSAPTCSCANVAKTESKSRSLVACRIWSCRPKLPAVRCRSFDTDFAISGLVGLTRSATSVALGTNSRSSWSLFRHQFGVYVGYPGNIAARSREAGDKPSRDGINAHLEDNGDRCGCRFCRKCRGRATRRDNHVHPTANQIGRQNRQPIVLAFCPAKIDRYIATLDKAGIAQALAKRAQRACVQVRRRTAEKADHRHCLLRGRYKWPRCRNAEKCDERAPPHCRPRGQTQGIVPKKSSAPKGGVQQHECRQGVRLGCLFRAIQARGVMPLPRPCVRRRTYDRFRARAAGALCRPVLRPDSSQPRHTLQWAAQCL